MKTLGLLVALFLVCIGGIALIAPSAILSLAPHLVTATGLYIAAAVRIVMGIVLLGAASASRMPKTMRVLGIIVLVAGIATAFLGVDRAHSIADWWSNQGSGPIRLFGFLAVALGCLIAYALVGERRAA